VVNGRNYQDLNQAGEDLATAAQKIGAARWPRYLNDARGRAITAIDDGAVPQMMKASATGTDILGGFAVLLGGLIIYQALKSQGSKQSGSAPAPNEPTIVQQAPPDRAEGKTETAPTHKPGEAPLPEDRRNYILDGDGKGGGGHGPGRMTPNKSKFPSDWSDEKTIELIKDVVNDPSSLRTQQESGRTTVEGSREGVDIRVIIGRDGQTIINSYPKNVPRN
jgi:hypothetical protein